MAILMTASVSASADQNTFTKWGTTAPRMAGFVGGADGNGSYAGEILKYTEVTATVIEALYRFNGAKHPFTALVHGEQTGMKDVISAVVTEGWVKGNQVVGECTQIASKRSPDGAAFQGTFDIMRTAQAGDNGYQNIRSKEIPIGKMTKESESKRGDERLTLSGSK
jgi:hypothetical protein